MVLIMINLCLDIVYIEVGGGNLVEVIKKYVDCIKYIYFKDYYNGEFFFLGEGY